MKFLWLILNLLLVIRCVQSANNCFNPNNYLAFLYKCNPEEFQEALICVGSGTEWHPKLQARISCANKKKIIVYFAAVTSVSVDDVTCENEPIPSQSQYEDCSEECKLDRIGDQCDDRTKCNLRLDEFLCFHRNVTQQAQSLFALRIHYICADELQRLEFMNGENYNSESLCATSSAKAVVVSSTTAVIQSTPDQHLLLAPTQIAQTDNTDEQVIVNVNGSNVLPFEDFPWTAKFISSNLEKTFLYSLLGFLIGLVLLLLLILCLSCCTKKKKVPTATLR